MALPVDHPLDHILGWTAGESFNDNGVQAVAVHDSIGAYSTGETARERLQRLQGGQMTQGSPNNQIPPSNPPRGSQGQMRSVGGNDERFNRPVGTLSSIPPQETDLAYRSTQNDERFGTPQNPFPASPRVEKSEANAVNTYTNAVDLYHPVSGNARESRPAIAYNYFLSAGWDPAHAAGLVGNLQTESGPNLDETAVGDNGQAKGIAQWHPDRRKKFEQVFKKPFADATFMDQLHFINWELHNSEKAAGERLRSTTDPSEAAVVVDQHYERSSGEARRQRIKNAIALGGVSMKGENVVITDKDGEAPLDIEDYGRLPVSNQLDVLEQIFKETGVRISG